LINLAIIEIQVHNMRTFNLPIKPLQDASRLSSNFIAIFHFTAASLPAQIHPNSPRRSNQITYTNILSACSSCGQWPSAFSLLSGMPRATVPPNVHSATAALCAYEMSGQWRGAMELLRRLGAWCWGGAYISNGKMGFLPVK
jgi:pentatricopeptide repeat protein